MSSARGLAKRPGSRHLARGSWRVIRGGCHCERKRSNPVARRLARKLVRLTKRKGFTYTVEQAVYAKKGTDMKRYVKWRLRLLTKLAIVNIIQIDIKLLIGRK
jgi:hypothetical protein